VTVTVSNATSTSTSSSTSTSTASSLVQGESFSFGSFASIYTDSQDSGGKDLKFGRNGTASKTVTLPAGTQLVARVRAWACSRAPQLVVAMDGKQLQSIAVSSSSYINDVIPVTVSAGSHKLAVTMSNGAYTNSSCGNSIHFDDLTVGTGAARDASGARTASLVRSSGRVAIQSGTVTDRQGVASVRLTCVGGQKACAGTLKLTRGGVVLGSAQFRIAAGHSAVVKVRVARRTLKGVRKSVRIVISAVSRTATGQRVSYQRKSTLYVQRKARLVG
jgi:hypothetical protein